MFQSGDEGVDESSRSDILCSMEQMKNRKKIKKRLQFEGTLDAAVPVKNSCIRHNSPNECEQVEAPVKESENIELDSFNHF